MGLMLKNGIYEQIVNTRINKELQQLDREKYDIELEKLDGEDAAQALETYSYHIHIICHKSGFAILKRQFPVI